MTGLLIIAGCFTILLLGVNYVSKQSQDNPDNFMSTNPESCAEVHRKFWKTEDVVPNLAPHKYYCPICEAGR